MENQIPFNEAMFTLATGWMTVWLYWMAFAIAITPLVLICSKTTRLDAVIVFLTNLAMFIGMGWVYEQMKYRGRTAYSGAASRITLLNAARPH